MPLNLTSTVFWGIFRPCTLAMLLTLSLPLFAQVTVGNIVGTVLTPGGAVLPNASVTIVNEGTNVTRRVSTDSKGDYQAADLDPGTPTL